MLNKSTGNSRASKQCQPVDFSCSSISGFKRGTVFTALALGLISKPYFAYAEENAIISNLQTVAEVYAQEIGNVFVGDRWTRIKFNTTYIDPVVVVERSNANVNNTYVVGVRNVDKMGFEIRLKNCNNPTGIPRQENVDYSVIEKSELPSTKYLNVTQQFSWGECEIAAAADKITREVL